LIAYTVEAAITSRYIDRVIISTDDDNIAKAAIEAGAERPFIRPSEFAKDTSPSWEAVIHALDWLQKNEGKQYTVFCLLQPTSPLRTASHVDEAIERYFTKPQADSLVTVCESSKSPFWSQIISPDDLLQPLIPVNEQVTRRQDLPKTFDINGAFYICDTSLYRRTRTFLNHRTAYYLMAKEDSIDIDTELDFIIAETVQQRKETR